MDEKSNSQADKELEKSKRKLKVEREKYDQFLNGSGMVVTTRDVSVKNDVYKNCKEESFFCKLKKKARDIFLKILAFGASIFVIKKAVIDTDILCPAYKSLKATLGKPFADIALKSFVKILRSEFEQYILGLMHR